MRDWHVFLAEVDASGESLRKERLRIRQGELFFHHDAGSYGRKRRVQALAIAVGFVVAAACRSLRDGVRVEGVDREVRRDDSCADHGPRFMPGLPAHRESVPALGALLREHLVNEVADMDHAPGFVEGERFIFNQFDDIGAIGHRHRRCGLVQRLGIDGEVRCGPGINSRARGCACRRACRRLRLRCCGSGGRYEHE